MRTHRCTEVNESMLNLEVTVCGWVHHHRDYGGLLFVDVRDASGMLQVVFDPIRAALFACAQALGREYVVRVRGVVRHRPDGMVNERMLTGRIEIDGMIDR